MKFAKKKSGVAFIIENKQLLGIVTDGDIRRSIQNKVDIDNTMVSTIMTQNPKNLLDIDNLHTIKLLLNNPDNKISCIPVVNINNEVVGLINNEIISKI